MSNTRFFFWTKHYLFVKNIFKIPIVKILLSPLEKYYRLEIYFDKFG